MLEEHVTLDIVLYCLKVLILFFIFVLVLCIVVLTKGFRHCGRLFVFFCQ